MNSKILKSTVAAATTVALAAGCIPASLNINKVNAESSKYGDALKLSLYFFDANECGEGVDDNPLTWRKNCHTEVKEAKLSDATGLTNSEISVIKATNGGKDTVDVSGGYHDAGDTIVSSLTMGFSATSLAWSYYSDPDAYKNTGSEKHLFDILKKMCDYFMKVTYLDDSGNVSSFVYLVGDSGEHNVQWTSPENETYNRKTYWASASHPSADTAGEMSSALAASSIAFKNAAPEYSAKCLKYAKALHSFAEKYPGASYDGIGDMYASSGQVDDIAWSDLWCHLADGTIDSYKPVPVNGDGSYNVNGKQEYDGWIYSWGKVWGGYSTLLYQLGFNDYKQTVLNNMNRLCSNPQAGQYKIVANGWGSSRYSCAWQAYSLNYAKTSGETKYADNAKTQMDYLLGENPDNRSYLIGFTNNYPKRLHHRAANPDKAEAKYTLYGSLVGGPTDDSGKYDDNADSYACTEPALDYNGCFVIAIAGLCDAFGSGDGSGADAVIKSASEIDENHVFGAWLGEEKPTDPEKPVSHDINSDGKFNTADVVLMQKYILNIEKFSKLQFENADFNSDGKVNAKDLTLAKTELLK